MNLKDLIGKIDLTYEEQTFVDDLLVKLQSGEAVTAYDPELTEIFWGITTLIKSMKKSLTSETPACYTFIELYTDKDKTEIRLITVE
jgi:hypothetical protein